MMRVPYSEEEMKPFRSVAEKYIKSIDKKLNSEGIASSYELREGSAVAEIIKAEKQTGADVVVMSTHGHSGFGRWDHGSTADKVLHTGTVPLLLIRSE
jgi:nucleotide-binding universal stress UspA family protein